MSAQRYTLGILAGGRGERVGGADKGWLSWQGHPLIRHQLKRFGADADQILISANRELHRYQQLPAIIVSDLRTEFPGPLAGIEALIDACEQWPLVIIPCDMPLMPPDLPCALVDALAAQSIAVAFDGERQQHLCLALADAAAGESLRTYLDQGKRSVHGWLATQSVNQVAFADAPGAFRNINQLDPDISPP